MNRQTVKLNRRTLFYSLFGLLMVLIFAKYALQVGFPRETFLLVVLAAVCLGTKDEIIAMNISLIPLHENIDMHIATMICVAAYALKFKENVKINQRIIPIILMVIWELMHCFQGEFSVINFAGAFVPFLLCGLLMWTDAKKLDYAFIARCFAFSAFSVGIMLMGKIGYESGFNIEAVLLSMQRLGVSGEGTDNKQVFINPNSLGIICTLSVSGLLQIFMTGKKRISDVIMMVAILIIGALTISKTYIVLVAGMGVLFIMAQKKDMKSKIKMLFGILAVVIVTIVLLALIFPNVLPMFIRRFSSSDITTGRTDLMVYYDEFIRSSVENMMFGVGLQDFGYKLTVQNGVATHVPHNGIQEIIVAWGIPGLIFFGMFILDLIAGSRRENPHQKLLNYIPLILVLVKVQAGQIITSGYTMLTLAYCYLSLCHDFYGENEIQPAERQN